MGKEAKIGLAVIFGLFVILGVVVTVRVASFGKNAGPEFDDDAPRVAGAASATAEASNALPETAVPTKPSATRENAPAPEPAAKPTILSPDHPAVGADSSMEWRELGSPGNLAVTSDSSDDNSLPSYMPSPPRADDAMASERYAAAYPPQTSPDASVGHTSEDTAMGPGQSHNPWHGSQQGSSGNAAPETASRDYFNQYATRTAQYPQDTDRRLGEPTMPTVMVSDRRLGADVDPNAGLRADGTYEVQPNDNFWTISEKLFGTGSYFQALAEHNRGKVANPNQLQVGQIILAPDIAELEQKYPAYCPKPEHRSVARHSTVAMRVGHHGTDAAYTVVEGDTLYRIARYELGDASRWHEIYQLNREVIGESFNYLRPGTQLALPGKPGAEPADSLTRRPGSLY